MRIMRNSMTRTFACHLDIFGVSIIRQSNILPAQGLVVFSFCGVLLDTQSDFQIVIERICDGVNISILASVSLTLLVGDDGCVIYDMVYTNIHGQFVVAVFSGTIFENIRTINDRAVSIHTTLMRGVLFADMQNYDVPKLHITSGKKTLYMAGAFYIIEQVPPTEIHGF